MTILNNAILSPLNLKEWEEKELPEDLAGDKELLNSLYRLDEENILEVRLRSGGGVAVRARSYVGVFFLRGGGGRYVPIIVEPKIDVKRLILMISISEASDLREAESLRGLVSIPPQAKSIVDLLVTGVIKRYLEKLHEALIYGFLEMPRVEVEEGVVVRGRILSSLIPRSMFSSPSPKVAYEIQYYTVDNPVNRYILDTGYLLLREARGDLQHLFNILEHLLRIGGSARDRDIKVSSTIHRALMELDYIPSISAESVQTDHMVSMVPLDRPYIGELIKLSSLIRIFLKRKIPPHPGIAVEVPTLYIDMNMLFESFVRKIIAMAAQQLRRTKGVEIDVRRAGEREQALILEPEAKAYLVPDMVIELDRRPVAVGDVKYKKEPDPEGDRDSINQVYTYMHGWSVDRGFLVYPMLEDKPSTNRSSYTYYKLKGEKELYIARININEIPDTLQDLRNTSMFNLILELLEKLVQVRGK